MENEIEEICKRAIELPTCPSKKIEAVARRVRLKKDIEKLLEQRNKTQPYQPSLQYKAK